MDIMQAGPSITDSPSCSHYPQKLKDVVKGWEKTYHAFGGQDALPHCIRVLNTAIRHNVVELEKIGDRDADPNGLNIKLAAIIMAHLFRRGKDNRADFPACDFWRHKLVVDGFEAFDALRENDLGVQDQKEYARILQKPSIGLLARMADLTQYGEDGLKSEDELKALRPDKFYYYNTRQGKSEYVQIARAIMRVYAPLADLFQYRKLAGDLTEIAYFHVKPEIYTEVTSALRRVQAKAEATCRVAKEVVAKVEEVLHAEGYQFETRIRPRKHAGKVMEKVDRRAREDAEKGRPPKTVLERIRSLNDLVAFTIVLDSRNGRTITQNDKREFENVADIIVGITHGIRPLREGMDRFDMFTDMVSFPKANGYQSFHVDMAFAETDSVALEAIIRNRRMEQYAERGGAAHYLYKGGGEEAKVVARAYQNVMRAIENGTMGHVSVYDSASMRSMLFSIEDNMQTVQVPQQATLGEALICAGVDITRQIDVRPKMSMIDPAADVDTVWVRNAPGQQPTVNKPMLERLISRAALPSTREALLQMRRSVDDAMNRMFER